jgi:putative ABC transport system ATP-binding protein
VSAVVLDMTEAGREPANSKAPDIVTMSGVRFAWPGPKAFALEIEAFALPARERILLVGPSGSGKSTFLSLLAGIVTPAEGRLEVLGNDMAKLTSSARDRFRAEHFGIIFQMFNLLPYGSVVDNVVLPLSFAASRRERVRNGSSTDAGEARRLLKSLGLETSELDGLSAASLSVGQQQRVAAARALIGRPEIIVADEPTSALDRDRQTAFLDLLFAEVAAAGATLIMVSHEEELGSRFDRVLRLDDIAVASRRSDA